MSRRQVCSSGTGTGTGLQPQTSNPKPQLSLQPPIPIHARSAPSPACGGRRGWGQNVPNVTAQDVPMRQGQKRDRARELRRNMTLAERKLWNILCRRQLEGFRFRRQHPVGPYIADFACLDAHLIAEADGGLHMDSVGDASRDAFLRREGFHILRFWNNEAMANLEGVRALILRRCMDVRSHPGLPPHAGEGADQAG